MSSKPPSFVGFTGQNLVYAVTFCCSVGFLLFGYDLGFMGGLTTSQPFLSTFGHVNASLLGFLVSSYEVGALFGAVSQFIVGDRYGRKTENIAGASIVIVGAIIQSTSFGLPQFLVGRLVAGFGLGIMTTVIPVWLTECAMPKSRGRMMAMQLSNLIMGLIIANWIDYGMSVHYTGSIQWRFPCALQIVFCIIVVCMTPFLPESPRYLCATDQLDQATYVLAALRNGQLDSPDVVEEMGEIRYAINVEMKESGSWSDVFHDGGISAFTRVAIAFAANFFQQLSGVNVMSSLGPYVFQNSVGMSTHEALIVSGGLQVFYFFSSLIPWLVVDRIGRRKLFMTGSIGMGVFMTLSAIFIGIGGTGLGVAATVVLYLFQTFFTLGWQSNMWVYPSELLPLKIRLRGGALAVVSQWLFTFLVVEITPPMITNIGFKSYIVFAIINFATVPVVYFCFPETSRRPLEVVDLLFADRQDGSRPSIFQVVRDSVNKDYVKSIESQLQERARSNKDNDAIVASEKEKALENLSVKMRSQL
ncbi:putative hexose carrier protein [Mollisia scopiformis]|uniref:Putative hexose carrier protein n=1 Tax=Mollisia scopiformis TaxID=149040 RepID=A0A132BBH8_MOLSC|nr:putative hexose carrier protein [Mollisia scopiformis]KUJ09741.1 putative hexose carrier protein [Mollisia scopiformis]